MIHRDLKPSNILLASTAEQTTLKLADFGYARVLGETDLASTSCGTPLYMAPEVFLNRPYDYKADLWSVGCILYEMVCGKVPFNAQNQVQLFEKIKQFKTIDFPPSTTVSEDCLDLVRKLLRRDPIHRMTFSQFFWHPFVQNGREAVEACERSQGSSSQRAFSFSPASSSLDAPDASPRVAALPPTRTSFYLQQVLSATDFAADMTHASPLPSNPLTTNPALGSASPQMRGSDDFVMIDKAQIANFQTVDIIANGQAPIAGQSPLVGATSVAKQTSGDILSSSSSSSLSFSLSGSVIRKPSKAAVLTPPDSPPQPATTHPAPGSSPQSHWTTSPKDILLGAVKLASNSLGFTLAPQDTQQVVSSASTKPSSSPPNATFSSSSLMNSSIAERESFESVEHARQTAMAVLRLAESTEDKQDTYTLYCYTLSLFSIAFRRARHFYSRFRSSTGTLQNIVASMDEAYQSCLERAESLQTDLRRSYTSVTSPQRSLRILQLVFHSAKSLSHEGAFDEDEPGVQKYRQALLLLDALMQTEDLKLSSEHRNIVATYASKIRERYELVQLQMRNARSSGISPVSGVLVL